MRTFFLMLMTLIHVLVFSQTPHSFKSTCGYELDISTNAAQPTPKEFAVVEFSFNSSTVLKETSQVFIELQPLNDCFNGIDGEKFGEVLRIDISEKVRKTQNYRAGFDLVQRKCFSWRVVVISKGANSAQMNSQSEWIFSPFVY